MITARIADALDVPDHRRRRRLVQGVARRRRRVRGDRTRHRARAARRAKSARGRWPTAARARSTPCWRRRPAARGGACRRKAPTDARSTPRSAASRMAAPSSRSRGSSASPMPRRWRCRCRCARHARRRHGAASPARRRLRAHSRSASAAAAPTTVARACSRRSGVRLVDAAGNAVAPTPQGLATLARVDVAGLDARLAQSRMTIMSDVNNPLCGKAGATAVFGPQKGVAADRVAPFDATLARYATLLEDALRAARRAARPARVPRADWASRCSCWAASSGAAPTSSPT